MQAFDNIESHIRQHLSEIEGELQRDGGFKCPRQLDDVKDCLQSILAIRQINSQISALK